MAGDQRKPLTVKEVKEIEAIYGGGTKGISRSYLQAVELLGSVKDELCCEGVHPGEEKCAVCKPVRDFLAAVREGE
jgi:hypothetical protein